MARSALIAPLAAALAFGVLAAPASAARQPTKAEARGIAKAVKHGSGVRPAWVEAQDPLVSSASPAWALARQVATDAGHGRFQPRYVMLMRPQGSRRWVVAAVAGKLVGCGIAPNEVVKDLTGDTCPDRRQIRPVPQS